MMRVVMKIQRPFGCVPNGGFFASFTSNTWWSMFAYDPIEVPEPYQAGDDFTLAFARLPGVADRLAQYGQQPRSL
jgi:hypothetical protein